MSNVIDETGKIYGYLKVIKRAGNNKAGRALWECECKCGKIVNIEGSLLRQGLTKSCGCYQKEQTSKARKSNLENQTIGNFTILKYIPGSKEKRAKWQCRCNLCGNENVFIATSNLRIQESCGCLTKSKGERKIKEILTKNNIKFIQEKRFSDCNFDTNRQARFDFYLPELNCIIEYDGRQHYLQGQGNYDNSEKFQITQIHDQIKNNYCKEHNILLIRIPYTEFNNINLEMLLPETSKYLI